jgi:hypothetical protein
MEHTKSVRPLSVNWALALFWLTVLLGLIKLVRTLALPAGPNGHAFTVFVFTALYAVMVLVTVYLTLGASWARGIMLVLFLVGVLPAIPLVLAHFALMPFLGLLTCAQGLAGIVGLYLLFREPAARWYQAGRAHETR